MPMSNAHRLTKAARQRLLLTRSSSSVSSFGSPSSSLSNSQQSAAPAVLSTIPPPPANKDVFVNPIGSLRHCRPRPQANSLFVPVPSTAAHSTSLLPAATTRTRSRTRTLSHIRPLVRWRSDAKATGIPLFKNKRGEDAVRLLLEDEEKRETSEHFVIRECPFCEEEGRHIKNDETNMHKLYIEKKTALFMCHRCGTSGNWFSLKRAFGPKQPPQQQAQQRHFHSGASASAPGTPQASSSPVPEFNYPQQHNYPNGHHNNIANYPRASPMQQPVHETVGAQNEPRPLPMANQQSQKIFVTTLLHETKGELGREYLTKKRGLELRTLRRYGVGLGVYRFKGEKGSVATDCVTFPWIMTVRQIEEQEAARGAKFHWNMDTERWEPYPAEYDNDDGSPGDSVHNMNDFEVVRTDPLDDVAPEDIDGEEIHTTIQSSEVPHEDESRADPDDDDEEEEEEEDEDAKKDTLLVRRIKVRSLKNKAWQRMDPAGGGWGLFGLHTVPEDAKEIILTEGEYDAMAVWQATRQPCVSLPNGCNSLPDAVLPLLERFERVILWMDNDEPGKQGAKDFCKKIGVERCQIVTPTTVNCVVLDDASKRIQPEDLPKDANDALLQGLDLQRILDDAQPPPHEQILTFADLKDDVYDQILHPEKYKGKTVTSLPEFSKKLGGFRKEELTVLTGATGAGKTTFLSQLSLDLAKDGTKVLWGSFEVKNTKLIYKMLQQHAGEPLPLGDKNVQAKLAEIEEGFSKLPLHFLKFHGGSEVEMVLDAMEHAVKVNKSEFILLDNMQFMISQEKSLENPFGKFDIQDVAIEKFRRFASEHKIHLLLVIHPKKEPEGQKLDISSFYGGGKATQEADNVLILQKLGENKKLIDIKKNRNDGNLGHVNLHWLPQSCRFSEEQPGAQAASDAPVDYTEKSARQTRPKRQGAGWPPQPQPPDPDAPNYWDEHFQSVVDQSDEEEDQ